MVILNVRNDHSHTKISFKTKIPSFFCWLGVEESWFWGLACCYGYEWQPGLVDRSNAPMHWFDPGKFLETME